MPFSARLQSLEVGDPDAGGVEDLEDPRRGSKISKISKILPKAGQPKAGLPQAGPPRAGLPKVGVNGLTQADAGGVAGSVQIRQERPCCAALVNNRVAGSLLTAGREGA